MRNIPAIMATQHPDNACVSYLFNDRFISTQQEILESYYCFSDLGITEYMWDWEGKFVDEAVIDRLFINYYDYFKDSPLGEKNFLTFRVPNIWVESTHKLPRAFMNILTAENAAKIYKLKSPPLFEAILPMTTEASQLIYMQKTFRKISNSTEDIFDFKSDLDSINLIPLFEEFETIARVKNILHEYTDFLTEHLKKKPEYIRVMTARSDPALNAGFLPAKIGSKIAVSSYHIFENETGIQVFPIVGGGCLPFRGGINPENIEHALEEYAGYSTLTIQSAFRYDYSLEQVKNSIRYINRTLPLLKSKARILTKAEETKLNNFNKEASKIYKPIIENLSAIINDIAGSMPNHRERVQHIGLFGYSRGDGKVKLPRAIKFCGSLYSLGIPPEIIGSGRALALAEKKGLLPLIHELCPYLKEDFIHAGHYLNYENLTVLARHNLFAAEIFEDIRLINKILKIEIGPKDSHHMIHRNLTSNIFYKLRMNIDLKSDILQASEIRKSLG